MKTAEIHKMVSKPDEWSLELVQPDQLGGVWDLVRPGLGIVRAKAQADWRPEDIYMAVKTGNAVMYIGHHHGKYSGFLVLSLMGELSQAKTVFVWATYALDSFSLWKGYENLTQIAADLKATKIRFQTMRKGWERRLREQGFKKTSIVFEKDLTHAG